MVNIKIGFHNHVFKGLKWQRFLCLFILFSIFYSNFPFGNLLYPPVVNNSSFFKPPFIKVSWETYNYGGEIDSALVIRWSHLPYHVAFWRNYIPIWVQNENRLGIYFGWVEAAPYEPLCDDDREHMWLTVEEQTNRIKVKWVYDLTTFGGDIYHGDTQITENYVFYLNGLATREVTIRHGSDWEDGDRKKDGYEVAEWGLLNPAGTDPSHNSIRDGKIADIIDPWNISNISTIYWDVKTDSIYCSYSSIDYLNWRGQIHRIYTREKNADPFVIWGKDSMPSEDYYPDYIYEWTGKRKSYSHWPKKTDSYSEGDTSLSIIRAKNLLTHTPIVSYQFDKPFETINRTVGHFKWLIGMGDFSKLDLRAIARAWLEAGEIRRIQFDHQTFVLRIPTWLICLVTFMVLGAITVIVVKKKKNQERSIDCQ